MSFYSVLFEHPDTEATRAPQQPPFFTDLRLDQIVETMTTGRADYDLTPFLYQPLHDVAAVHYRQDILRDLEHDSTREAIAAFSRQMRQMRQHLAQAEQLHHRYQQERWFVDAVSLYGEAVSTLATDMEHADIASQGLRALHAHLNAYSQSSEFVTLVNETRQVLDALGQVRYAVHIQGSRVTVSQYEDEPDYSAAVEETFARFKQGAVKDHRVKFPNWPEMNHVEAQVLDFVARLYPEVFSMLDDFCARHRDFVQQDIARFDREVQLYLAYLEYIHPLRAAGLAICYPEVSTHSKEIYANDMYDLALAAKLVRENVPVICNEFALHDPERICVVTGPNQGGKTTFARTVGQLHYLASLGLPVPGRSARLYLPDQLFTHFEREEDPGALRGKLEDELLRIHDILEQATSASIIIMNESFASTTLHDALLLGANVLRQISELDALCVYVTFVDELASLNNTTVSMVSTVQPDNPAVRTFKIVRQPANGLAYAAAIAEKYGLTYAALRRRIAP